MNSERGIALNHHHHRDRKWLRYGLPFNAKDFQEIQTLSHLHSFSLTRQTLSRWEHHSSPQQQVDLPSLDTDDNSIQDFEIEYIPLEEVTSSNALSIPTSEKILLRLESRREHRSIFNAMALVNFLQRSTREDIRLVLLIDADFSFPSEFHKYIDERAPNTEYYTNLSEIPWIDTKINLSVEGFQGKDIMKIFEMMNRIHSCKLEIYPTCQELNSSIFDTERKLIDMLETFYMSFNYNFLDWSSALAAFHRHDTISLEYDETTLFKIKEVLDDEIQFSLAGIHYTWEPNELTIHRFGPEFGEFLLSLLGNSSTSKNGTIFVPTILSDENPGNTFSPALFSNDSTSIFMHEIKNLGQINSKGGKFPDLFACHRTSENGIQYSIVDAKGRFGFSKEKKYRKFYQRKSNLSKYSIGLQGFPVSIICAQFFAHDDPSSLTDSPPSLDIFLQCQSNGFTLKIFDLNAPCWTQGVTIQQMKDFLFDEITHPENEQWRFENWLESKTLQP